MKLLEIKPLMSHFTTDEVDDELSTPIPPITSSFLLKEVLDLVSPNAVTTKSRVINDDTLDKNIENSFKTAKRSMR